MVYHITQLTKISFDENFDLMDEACCNFFQNTAIDTAQFPHNCRTITVPIPYHTLAYRYRSSTAPLPYQNTVLLPYRHRSVTVPLPYYSRTATVALPYRYHITSYRPKKISPYRYHSTIIAPPSNHARMVPVPLPYR